MSYSFQGVIKLESSILRGPVSLFEQSLEFELYCVEMAARKARIQAVEEKHGQSQIYDHSSA